MREILFRGKRVDNGEWVEGFLVIAEDTFKPDDEKTCFILEADVSYFGHGEFSGVERVDPETVGQFTGLTDKNGKKIFEGDIVTMPAYAGGKHKAVVYFKSGKFAVDGSNYSFKDIAPKRMEVIGNIHDNLELLK
jgi:uncharacterized phage protein (TIGR01671 family)